MMRSLARSIRGAAGSIGSGLSVLAPAVGPLPAFIAERGQVVNGNAIALFDPTAIAVGSLLILAGYNDGDTPMANLADPRNVWTIEQQRANPWSARRLYFASCRVVTPYQAGDVVSWTGPAGARIFAITEFGPIASPPGAYRDGSVSAASDPANQPTVSSGNLTTTVERSLLVGAVGWTFASVGPPDSVGAFNRLEIWTGGTNERVCICWRAVPAIVTDAMFWDHEAANVGNAVAALGAFVAA